ncbi:MAG: 3-methylornithyl-N6-L-lysine dehydrogenase PylD [Phycisphaeraceae bacterium]|nr:3-methylornithyl-N6-L-lysine dehydrogenase PylD [Phycisphaeraceae bacterium]
MTRLRTEDIDHIGQDLDAYDQRLLKQTGHTLGGIACHAHGLSSDQLTAMAGSFKVCVIPLTCGQGVIHGFSAAVSCIISHLGFDAWVTQASDAAGMAEAFENKADIILLADDDRFVAINVRTQCISDNSEMTAKGFVAGLDLMTSGLRGKAVLVIGCGTVGCCAARRLAAMGVMVCVCDINPLLALALQQQIMDELGTAIHIDNDWHATPGKYPLMIDATPGSDVIDVSVITPDTCVAVPGVPCGLSQEVRTTLSDRILHDPLQIGVATMVIDACIQPVRDAHDD